MDDTLNLVNLQVRISVEEHEQLKALKDRIRAESLQKMVRQILRDAIAGKSGYPYPASRQEHEELERILQNTDLRPIVRQQLKVWMSFVAASNASKQTKAG
jgi:hypothetical protein